MNNNHNSNSNQNTNSAISPNSHSQPHNVTSVIVNGAQQQSQSAQSTPTSATYSINGILGIEEQQRHQKRKNPSPNENHIEGKSRIQIHQQMTITTIETLS